MPHASAPVVFPLFSIVQTPDGPRCGCGNDACGRIGKHPRVAWGEVQVGSAVPRPEPGAGSGLKTGAAPKGSDCFVVDIDSAEACARWDALDDERAPPTYTVETPRGWHLYFQHPDFHVRNSAGKLAKGIDIRGDGGFVVAAGSPHRSGKAYAVLHDDPIAPAPAWLLEWLKAQGAPAEVQSYPGDVTDATELAHRSSLYIKYLRDEAPARGPERRGEGDAILFQVVQRGAYDLALPGETVLALIAEHYDPRCDPPWGAELEERVAHKVKCAKTQSTRPRKDPWHSVVADMLADAQRPAAENIIDNSIKPGTTQDSQTANTKPKRLSPSERALKVGGRGLRLATGLPSVDAATRGGLLLRKVFAIGGAPGAGKTALAVQLAYRWLLAGVHVAFLAADEDADALLIRFGQLAGLSRDALENGDPDERIKLAAWCASVPLILADGDEDETLEQVSRDLRDAAYGKPSALIADSIQTVRTGAALPNGADVRARINVVVRSLKHSAKVDGHLVVTTSEISKAAYRNKAQADNINPLSAFKESGDIEYGVGLAIVLTSRQGTSELVDAVVAKNRLGPGKPEFMLKLNHTWASVTETSAAEAQAADPLYFVKEAILEEARKAYGAPMTRNRIADRVGGNRAKTLEAINQLVEARILFDDKRGVRIPMPGDPGYVDQESST